MRQINRITPALPAGAYKTYQILAPLSTHFRAATCEEVDCPNHLNGWRTVIDEASDLGQRQAQFIRADARRRFVEERGEDGLTVFTFIAGQRCFNQHKTRLDRPERYLVRGGDWRGDPSAGRPVEHTRPDFWLEDFALHQQQISTRIERG